MKRILLILVGAAALLMTSCGSMADFSDFQRGFREGWNQTAPPEYRY